jgi:hypothetical protein
LFIQIIVHWHITAKSQFSYLLYIVLIFPALYTYFGSYYKLFVTDIVTAAYMSFVKMQFNYSHNFRCVASFVTCRNNVEEKKRKHLDDVLLRVAVSSSDDASRLVNRMYSRCSLWKELGSCSLLLERLRSCPSTVWVRSPGLGWVSDVGQLVQIVPVTRHISVGFEVFTAVTMKNGVFWCLLPG